MRLEQGTKIYFWEGRWSGERPLKDIFPNVYLLAANRLAKVVDYMERSSNSVVWNPMLRRAAFDWEIPQICSLMETLGNVILGANQVDKRRWMGSAEGCFSVKSCYNLMESSRDIGIPWKTI